MFECLIFRLKALNYLLLKLLFTNLAVKLLWWRFNPDKLKLIAQNEGRTWFGTEVIYELI